MKVLVSGSGGLIGSALVRLLEAQGHVVGRLVRRPAEPGDAAVRWDPSGGEIDEAGIEGFDAVVHLAGENVARGRWTPQKKRAIRESRVGGTRLLCRALSQLTHPPRVVVCASAVGFYGDRGSDRLDEESEPGQGFLPEVCCAWEAASAVARAAGVRVVNLRIGVVLSPRGGALARMLPLFRLGLGGVIGRGNQYISWIDLDDVVDVIRHVLVEEKASGPVNAVSPEPVTNREITQTLGRLLRRPTFFTVPAPVVRLAFGEMGEALLLASAMVLPRRLVETGYEFSYPRLEVALEHALGAER